MIRINTPTVVSEVFDDEIVIINLELGTYYSLDQGGVEIWKMLEQGIDLDEMHSQLAVSYALPIAEIAQGVQQFLATLAQENLIVTERKLAQTISIATDNTVDHAANHRGHFASPTLTKFTDMQELLLLDPIHDVTEAGWPHVQQ